MVGDMIFFPGRVANFFIMTRDRLDQADGALCK